MKYGDAIEEIKRILSESKVPHFICDDCASIVIADSRRLLTSVGKALELDKNDPRFRSISQDIIEQLRSKHKQLHSMPDDEYVRRQQMEWAEYGKALETILKLAGKYNNGGLTSHKPSDTMK